MSLSQAGVLVGKTLVDIRHKEIPVRVLNLANQSHHICKGTLLASCQSVLSVETGQLQETTENPVSLPEHLKSLFDRAATDLSSDQRSKLRELLSEFSGLFSAGPHNLGCNSYVEHTINTGDAPPIRQTPRRLPLAKRETAQQAIREMEHHGQIEPSHSPWASPVVLVKKKDGSTRFCVDYRRLNAVTKKDSYPLPRIDDALETLAGMCWFSTLDLRSGYWQVKMSDTSKEKTAFTTGSGLWQFTVMPFGLCNALATFERLMERALSGLPPNVALVYIDDILVSGRSFQDHLCNLRTVFRRLQDANLKLSPKKCNLFQKEVKYLGHVVSADGVSTDPQKAETIHSWPEPTSITDVRSFLGLCSYYRRFIPSFADIAKPLHQLLESGRRFEWTTEAHSAFLILKEKLTQTPILGFPLPNEPFILDTDASSYATGVVLSQIHEGKEKVIAYYSRSLNSAEKQYCVTRIELLAIIRAIKQFHCYLYGQRFTVRTDHAALTWLLKFRNPEGQIVHWIQRLQEYDFEITHRAGLKHNNADALFRRPCLQDNCRHCDQLETRDNQVKTSAGITPCGNSPLIPLTVNSVSFLSDIVQYKELRSAQLHDPDIKPILKWKESISGRPSREEVAGCSPDTKLYWAQWKSLSIRQGVLHRDWETAAGDTTVPQLILPRILRKEVFTQLHNTPTSGHLGISKTLEHLRSRFYWPGLHSDVKKWCASCDDCASRRGPPTKPRAPLAKYTAGAPAE